MVLHSFPPAASHIHILVDELSKIDNLPHKLSWPWVEVDISRKRITEKTAKQLPPHKPGFAIVRLTMPAINEGELKEAIREWSRGQPRPSLLGYLVITEDIQQQRRLILLYKNPYVDSKYCRILDEVLSCWKYRLDSVVYSFLKDRATPVQAIVSNGSTIFAERPIEP